MFLKVLLVALSPQSDRLRFFFGKYQTRDIIIVLQFIPLTLNRNHAPIRVERLGLMLESKHSILTVTEIPYRIQNIWNARCKSL